MASSDVDDLEEIGKLEVYIDHSAAVSMFLSTGYFKSINCLREIEATVKNRTPFMLTHEADASKGGGALDEIKEELDDKLLRDAVFLEDMRVTTWYRIAEFQLVSLKQIAEFTLLQTPEYKGQAKLDIFVQDELLRQHLRFTAPVILRTSPNNPGARAFAAELERAYGSITLKESSGSEVDNVNPTHLLLYLNMDTFRGDVGAQLASELRDARLPIVMVHENDPQRGGCAFERFFQTTSGDLINSGLYKPLAFAAYAGDDHRAVGTALIARALGAVPNDSGSPLSDISVSTVRSTSNMGNLTFRLLAFARAAIRRPRAGGDTELLALTLAKPVTM